MKVFLSQRLSERSREVQTYWSQDWEIKTGGDAWEVRGEGEKDDWERFVRATRLTDIGKVQFSGIFF